MKVVITGAGRGLGLEMVRRHLKVGDSVLALSHSMTDELKACECENENLKTVLCELTDYDSIISIADKTDGPVDVLYNIAGLYYEDQRIGIEETDMTKALKMYEVNALAPLGVMKAFANHMRSGSVNLIVSSEAGSIGECGRSEEYGYCMSKAAVNMAAKIFSNETSKKGIRTILYHPGWMRTRMGGERAAASQYSIEASESADSLMEIIDKAIKASDSVSGVSVSGVSGLVDSVSSDSVSGEDVLFTDYTGKIWKW